MPTGLTDELDTKNLDTKTWIMKHLARSFCICIMMKDAESSEYHTNKLNHAKKEIKKFQSMTMEQWERKMEYENQQNKKRNNEFKNKAIKLKKKHDGTRKDLEKILQTKGISTITRNIVQFGIDQLNIVEDECKPYVYDLIANEYFYKKENIDNAKHDIQYHQKELREEIKRGKERLKLYLQLRKDINRIPK